MTAKDKLKTIEQQITSLQSKKKKLEDRRKDQIIRIINRCNASNLPDEVLAGAILDVTQAYVAKDDRVAKWKTDGVKIMNPGRGRRKTIHIA